MRSYTCQENAVSCGSNDESDHQFCIPKTSISGTDTCLPNHLEVFKSNGTSNNTQFSNLGRNMTYKMDNSEITKNPISDIATVGIYYWAKGSDYVKYAEQMIRKNIRTNNEFYTCPTFNEAINDNKKIKVFNINKMWGLGTPEDLKYYLENKK